VDTSRSQRARRSTSEEAAPQEPARQDTGARQVTVSAKLPDHSGLAPPSSARDHDLSGFIPRCGELGDGAGNGDDGPAGDEDLAVFA